MKKKLAVMVIAACVAASSVAGAATQSVSASPKLKLASEVGNANEQQEETEGYTDEEDASEEAAAAPEAEEPEFKAEDAAEETAQEDVPVEGSDDTEAEDDVERVPEDEYTDKEAGNPAGEDIDGKEESISPGIANGATISVSGTGSTTITPDGATLYVGFTNTEESSKEAQTVNVQTINAVIDALLQAGVEEKDISTSAFDIYADYDYIDGSSVLVGYRVYTMLTVSNLDIDAVGDLIDAAVDAGANEVEGIVYTYSDTEEACDQALQAALERALDKAELLAESAGGELGSILSIQEDEYSYGTMDARVYEADEAEITSDSGSSMTVMAGETEVTATVTVTYLLEEGRSEMPEGADPEPEKKEAPEEFPEMREDGMPEEKRESQR